MAYGEDIEYCEGCGAILEMNNSCQVCGKLTPEGEYEQENDEPEEELEEENDEPEEENNIKKD
jgi:hypothetical protein